MRVYVPATVEILQKLVADQEFDPMSRTAFAVTPTLRESYAAGDDDELAEVAMGEAARASLRLIGITISAHVAGMYACSPLFGLLADRVGRRWTLALGFVVQLASLGLLIAYGQQDAAVVVALVLLGLGWSAALVSCSALLIDAAPDTHRTHIQGRSDFTMNIVGAAGGAVAGPIVHNWGMPTLASLTGFLIIVAVVVLLPRVRDISTR